MNQNWNNNKCGCYCKNSKKHCACKKDYICNPARCSCKNGIYLASIIDNSKITCDEIIDTTKTVSVKTVPTTAVPKNALQQIPIFYSLF